MAVESVGSSSTGSLDLNSLLQSALTGGTMSNLFSGDQSGSNFVMGALLGRLLFNQNGLDNNNQNADRAAIDAAVAAALANANQQNNNSMTLLKDIQDSSQEVVSAVNSTSQTNLIQQLQSQIAIQQGQATLGTAISESKGAVVNEVHEVGQVIGNQLDTINTNLLQGFNSVTREINADGAQTRALITQNMVTELNNQLADLRTQAHVASSGINVTNNIAQNQNQQQQQQQIWNINNLLQDLLAQQKITQSTINLGTMSGSAGQQTSANTRIGSI